MNELYPVTKNRRKAKKNKVVKTKTKIVNE